MCEWVQMTVDGRAISIKSSDCNWCGCPNSDKSGQHSYYNGVCLQCGAKE